MIHDYTPVAPDRRDHARRRRPWSATRDRSMRAHRRRRLFGAVTDGTRTMATYPHDQVPSGLATRRQLRDLQMRPRGHPVALIAWPSQRTTTVKGLSRGIQVAYLYRTAAAMPEPPPRASRRPSFKPRP
jgi:hypothetical protein